MKMEAEDNMATIESIYSTHKDKVERVWKWGQTEWGKYGRETKTKEQKKKMRTIEVLILRGVGIVLQKECNVLYFFFTSLEQLNSGEINSILASCGSKGISLILWPEERRKKYKNKVISLD